MVTDLSTGLCRELLGRALAFAGGTHTIEDVEAGIATGEFQLWQGERSVLLTKLLRHPQLLEASCFLASGDLEEIRSLYQIVLDWAKSKGCTRASFVGRPGWAKTWLTKEEGWSSRLIVYEKEL